MTTQSIKSKINSDIIQIFYTGNNGELQLRVTYFTKNVVKLGFYLV